MRRSLFVVALVSAAGCSGISTSTDYDPAADFSRYKSWSWFKDGEAQPGVDSLTDGRIRSAVDAGLDQRGYPRVEAEEADFLVQYHVAVEQRIDARPSTVGYGSRYGAVGSTEISAYDEGTLVLDFLDGESKNLVWRGTARAIMTPSKTPEERKARIREAVAKMLDRYPPAK